MNSTNRNAAEARGVPETDQLGGRVNRENSLTTRSVQGHRAGRRPRLKGDLGLHVGQPVYVASEWGVKLRHDHPDLFNQIINTCDDLDVLQQIYDQHKDVLAKYRQ